MPKENFNLMDLLNQRSKETVEKKSEKVLEDAENIMIDIYDLAPSKENFYDTKKEIEELKQSIELVGLLQPLLVKKEGEKYRIISGHRRRIAMLALVKEGKERFRKVPCVKKDSKNAIMDRLALIMATRYRDKTDWEKMTEVIKTEELVLKLREEYEIKGKTRELISEIVKSAPAQIGRYKTIYKNLCSDLMEEFKNDNIGISAVYEAAGMSEEWQERVFELYKENGTLSINDVITMKEKEEEAKPIPGQIEMEEFVENEAHGTEEKGEQRGFEANPEKIISKCFSCANWEQCSEKGEAVDYCLDFKNKDIPGSMSERELQETHFMNKPENQTVDANGEIRNRRIEHDVKTAAEFFEDAKAGIKPFELRKNDRDYKVGDFMKMRKYKDGEWSGDIIRREITYVLEDHEGLKPGYCILGVKDV
nr:DUF3850 domain-containing protein [uncultured Anaerostipes sp.]